MARSVEALIAEGLALQQISAAKFDFGGSMDREEYELFERLTMHYAWRAASEGIGPREGSTGDDRLYAEAARSNTETVLEAVALIQPEVAKARIEAQSAREASARTEVQVRRARASLREAKA